jgi:hypothetical protein
VRVARNRDDGVTIEQIATDFGVAPEGVIETQVDARVRRFLGGPRPEHDGA